MNKNRKNKIRKALDMLSGAQIILEDVLDEESESISNYPENLQSTEIFEFMERCEENLGESISKVEEAIELLFDI